MSGPKRQWSDPIYQDLPLKRLRAASNSLRLSSLVDNHAVLINVIPNEAATTPGISVLSASTSVPRATQAVTSPAISALETVRRVLRDSLIKLPLLQTAIGDLFECVIHTEVEEPNRQAFNEMASNMTNLATLLRRHATELEACDGPYSIARLVQVIDEKTKLIRAQQGCSRTSRPTAVKDDEGVVIKCYQGIGSFFKRLQSGILTSLREESKEQDMDTIRKDLSPVYGAYHNAALPTTVTQRVGCTQGTRMGLLNTTLDWICDGDAVKIFWLNGMAGTGKTTIAYTLCEKLKAAKQLGASFFCSRNSADCCNVNRIVPTIAYQLGQHSSLYRQELLKALKSYSDTSKRNISAQFEHLILHPFENIGETMPKDVIVVIDALDECADEAGTKVILDLLIRHVAHLPVKFFIASRPEPIISDYMEARTGALRSILWLHDIAESLVQADIKLYLAEELASINVSPSEIDLLAAKAGKLFIFAATAVRYIRPDRGAVNHRKRLLEVLELRPDPESLRHQDINRLYATILLNALNEKIYTKAELTTRRQVLRTVICAKEPLTISALAELLDIAHEDIRPAILPLQSVLHQSEETSVVSALHASFPDFLLAEERAGEFYCDEVIQNAYLADCCFKLMGRSLKFNICGLKSSYAFDKDVPNLQTRTEEAISTALFYSCRYWGDHITRGPSSPAMLLILDTFLKYHLLFWMEVLNLKRRVGHGEIVLSQVLAWLPARDEWTGLCDFTYDARNFLTSFTSDPTSLSTPHIYISALPFTSKESRVRATYWPRMRGLIDIEGIETEGSGKSALATWGVGSRVWSLARSSDGRQVVSGSDNNEVNVWDVSSGARILEPLGGHGGPVWSVAFSPDSSRIAAGCGDHTIRVWDSHNGDLVAGPFRVLTPYVYSVAFSPDGTRLASGLSDCTVRMWNAHTGAEIGDAYRGHRGKVWSVAFSPDSEHLASGSADHTIRVWDWRTGATALGPLKGHTGQVYSVAYSSDGSRLASGSGDCTVRVWDMPSGILLAGPFEGHTGYIVSVSFSPNDMQIVSGSFDQTIRVWEAESGNLLAGPFEGHGFHIHSVLFTTDGTRILSGSKDGTVRVWDARHKTTGATESLGHSGIIWSVSMSPDGTRAASGSYDNTICVWDTHTGALVAGPFNGHTKAIYSVAFSPDGARIVSGSVDHTLRIWDACRGTLLADPFKGHTDSVNSVAFSPDGNQIASGSDDKTIRLWDSRTGTLITEPFEGHTWRVCSIAYSPISARIVSGSGKTVRMWDAHNSTVLWRSDVHIVDVSCVAFSSDGTCVVSCSRSHILVLDATDGAVLHTPFTGHTREILSVAFSPDGTCVVSSSSDQTVCVWDVENGAVVAGPLKGHTKSVESAAFSPDGARIISASADRTIRFWDVASAAQPDATPFDGWSIHDDGWVIDSQSQRLFWVPPGLRDRFWFSTPSNPLTINACCTIRADHTTLFGDRWNRCYDPSLGQDLS